MSHPDPLYDTDNSYEDDEMFTEPNESDIPFVEYLYANHDDFFDEDSSNYHPDAAHEISTHVDEEDDVWDDSYDDSMDGDHESGFASAGWGVDESYHSDIDSYENYYGEDY